MGFFDGLSGMFNRFNAPNENVDMSATGEQFANALLKNHFCGEFELFQKVYLEKKSGSRVEIDLIAVGSKAIILFEFMDCSGCIFGNEKSKNWTQTLPNGQKKQFPNPTRQSKSLIETLKYNLSEDSQIPIYSFVLFGEDCDLRDVKHSAPNTHVIQQNRLIPTLEKLLKSLPPVIQKDDSRRIKELLKKASSPTEETQEKQQKKSSKISEKCPKCGAKIKEKTNKATGKVFYECAAYPKCKYTTKTLKTTQTAGKRK